MKKVKGSIKYFLSCIYGFAFFNKMLLLAPVYSVFMQNNGMTDMQISSLFIIFSIGIVGVQIPVTWLANKIGHKYSIIFGQFLKAVAFILWVFFPNYIGFAIGMFLWGTQTAIYNVSFQTLVYDELKARGRQDIYAKILGNVYSIQSVAVAFAASGSLLMFLGYGWVTLFSVIALFISTLFITAIKTKRKNNKRKVNVQKIHSLSFFKTVYKVCKKTPCIFMLAIVLWATVNFAYLDDYLSLIGLEIGIPVEYVGGIVFFCLGCSFLGQKFAYLFIKVKDWVLYTAICVLGISLIMFSLFYSIPALFFLGFVYVLRNMLFVLLYARLQNFTPTLYRPVILSLYSMGDNLTYIFMSLLIGLGGSLGSWSYGTFFAGTLLFLTGIWAMMFVKDKCSRIPNEVDIEDESFKALRPASK